MDKIIYTNQIKYLESLRAEREPVLAEMELLAAQKKIPILNWNAAELLESMILAHRPKRILEIGTAIAYSSIRMARLLRKKGIVDTIEKSLDNISIASGFISKAGLDSKINLIEGDALNIIPQLEKKYDFIFLDADKQDYEKLFYYSIVLLKKGGVIFIDNLLWHGFAAANKVPPSFKNSAKIIRDFNKAFMNHTNLRTSILPVGDGIGIGIKL